MRIIYLRPRHPGVWPDDAPPEPVEVERECIVQWDGRQPGTSEDFVAYPKWAWREVENTEAPK